MQIICSRPEYIGITSAITRSNQRDYISRNCCCVFVVSEHVGDGYRLGLSYKIVIIVLLTVAGNRTDPSDRTNVHNKTPEEKFISMPMTWLWINTNEVTCSYFCILLQLSGHITPSPHQHAVHFDIDKSTQAEVCHLIAIS